MIVSPSQPTPAGVRDRWLGSVVVVLGICVGTQRARAISPVREAPLSPVRKEIGDRGSRAETPSPRRVDHRCATPVVISAGDQVAPWRNTPSNKTMVMEISRNPGCASPNPRRGQASARVLGRLVWVRRELVQSKSFTADDCFPIGRERLPILTEVSFSRDLWNTETGKISYVEVVAMNGVDRGGGRGGAGRGAGNAAPVQKQQVPVIRLQRIHNF
jgi:hypothetical protein